MNTDFMSLLFCSDGMRVVRGFFFSNWLLMYLAGNYCDSDKSSASPTLVSAQALNLTCAEK